MTEQHLTATCRPGTAECCRYLAVGASGWLCLKLDASLRAHRDARVAAGTMRARGDNCPGVA